MQTNSSYLITNKISIFFIKVPNSTIRIYAPSFSFPFRSPYHSPSLYCPIIRRHYSPSPLLVSPHTCLLIRLPRRRVFPELTG